MKFIVMIQFNNHIHEFNMTKQLENTILFSYFKNIDQNHSWNLITTISYGILIRKNMAKYVQSQPSN